ncbi:MAG TPA: hypothetical protein VN873_06985 [Candidatus Angelobacter sp.]|nr:hypothetical protein [Candidatus Angelobacter sp.]
MNRLVIVISGILFGISCFLLGRFSVTQKISPTLSKAPPIALAIQETATKKALPPIAPEVGLTVAPPTAGWQETKWSTLLSQPGSPERNSEMAGLLEQLGAADPTRAMALASTEKNLKFRDQLTQAALHGWARTSPADAAQWALNLTDSTERETALSRVFAGAAAADPETAMRLGNQIIAQHPNDAIGYGSRLIDALIDHGDFAQAAQWAATGDLQTTSSWMAEAYSRWAEFQPQQAAAAAEGISDPAQRSLALHGIVDGFAQADPAGLVQFVMQLPADTDRDSILSQSLERWAREDPVAAAQWLSGYKADPALDQGAAAVAGMESLPPGTAVAWAENIVSPQLRSETLAAVLRNWLTTDRTSAENYFASTKDLLPEDRQQIAEVIAARNGHPSAQ